MNDLTISPKTALVTTLLVAVTLIVLYGAYLLIDILLILFGAIIFSAAIQPIVTILTSRRVNRSLAILGTYLVIVGAFLALLVFSIPPLVTFLSQVIERDIITEQLAELLIDVRLTLWNWAELRSLLPMVRMTPELAETIANTSQEVGKQALPVMQQTGVMLGKLVLLLALAYYWLSARQDTLDLVLRFTPSENRAELRDLWNEIEYRLGAFLRAQVILMLIVGVASYIGLSVLQVPNAFALAVIAGLFEAMPLIGPIIGAVPAVLVALIVSPATALLVVLLYIVIQVVENNVLVPRLMSTNVGLNPLVVMVAIVAGASLGGIVGALFAIPVAGVIQGIAQHVWVPEPAAAESGDTDAAATKEAKTEKGNEETRIGLGAENRLAAAFVMNRPEEEAEVAPG